MRVNTDTSSEPWNSTWSNTWSAFANCNPDVTLLWFFFHVIPLRIVAQFTALHCHLLIFIFILILILIFILTLISLIVLFFIATLAFIFRSFSCGFSSQCVARQHSLFTLTCGTSNHDKQWPRQARVKTGWQTVWKTYTQTGKQADRQIGR